MKRKTVTKLRMQERETVKKYGNPECKNYSLETACGVITQLLVKKTLLNPVGFEVLTAVIMKSSIFCDITLCSSLKMNQHFCKPPVFMLVSCLAYFSIVKMEVTCSSKMSVSFQQTSWHYTCISKDRTLH
jgi:hypothetical protein